jgi:NAD-dependent DNA ligase
MCDNEFGCKAVYNSKLENLVKILDGKNIGEAVIKGISDMIAEENKELYLYTFFENFRPINGTYKYESKINMFYDNDPDGGGKRPIIFKKALENMFDNLTEIKLIAAMNIPYIGETSLLDHSIRSYKMFIDYCETLKKKPVLEEVFDITLMKWYNDKQKRMDLEKSMELCKGYFHEVEDPNDNTITYCISGEVSGFESKDKFVKTVFNTNTAFRYDKDVKTSTNYLVTNEKSTSKVLKAMKYKVPIISPEEFLKLVQKY